MPAVRSSNTKRKAPPRGRLLQVADKLKSKWTAVVVIVLVGGIGSYLLMGSHAQTSPANGQILRTVTTYAASSSTAMYRLHVSNPDGSGDYIITTPPAGYSDSNASWSPDGKSLVYVRSQDSVAGSQTGLKPGNTLYVKNLSNQLETQLPIDSGTYLVQSPIWSPDGSRVLVAVGQSGTADPSLRSVTYKWITLADKTSTVLSVPFTYPKTVASIYHSVFGVTDSNVYFVDDNANNPYRICSADLSGQNKSCFNVAGGTGYPVLSHAGNRVSYAVQKSDGSTSLYVANADGSSAQLQQLPATSHATIARWTPDDTSLFYYDSQGAYGGRDAVFQVTIGGAPVALNIGNDALDGFNLSWRQSMGDIPVVGDYNGDKKTDMAVWRPSTGVWYISYNLTSSAVTYTLGLPGDVPVPADYDGDGKTDVAVWRPSTGMWYIRYSSTGKVANFQYGQTGDIPTPADYNGDKKAELSVWRPSTEQWYIAGVATYSAPSKDSIVGLIPVPGDYNGDGKAEPVFESTRGQNDNSPLTWTNAANWTNVLNNWGYKNDQPAIGDYNGDRKADYAVWRASTGTWYSITGATAQWGQAGDIPVPGDYNGDGKTDYAVWRPSNGNFYISGIKTVRYGNPWY